MNGPQHFKQALKLSHNLDLEDRALVHAILALTAATVMGPGGGVDRPQWLEAFGYSATMAEPE